jgi:tricorn protease
VLLAVPLLEEIEYPWLPESDEEKWDEKDKDEDEEEKEGDEEEKGDEEEEEAEEGGGENSGAKPAADDGVSGTWEGQADTPEGVLPFTATIRLHSDASVTGSLSSPTYSGALTGSYDMSSRTLSLTLSIPDGPTIQFELKIDNSSMSGNWYAEGDEGSVTASRTAPGAGDEEKTGKDKGKKEKAREKVEIDLEGFERRAIRLPVERGNYRRLVVNDKNQLIYSRSEDGIKLFDIKDKKKEEKTVSSGGGDFTISGDGKKLLVIQGRSASIQNAAAGGSGKKVVTRGMTAFVNPREEWRQIFVDAWRLERDFFYVDNLHGVDWPAVRMRYEKMLDNCVTREEVSFVIREMISELNVGHAYYSGGDVEDEPRVSVGMLGVDWALENGAYRVKKIYEGGPWDADARNPLNRKGIDIKEGDHLLAVNGEPMDTSRDPWAAFLGLSGQAITVTVSENPVPDDKARDVVVEPMGSESNLRYRAWIEANRAYVDEQSGGRVGYIYVPNTGRNGQNDLVRQYFAQVDKQALIIDERWNGGGQIPDRFIEMLNRPVSNYWARRHGKENPTPSFGHQGPKCMLINGLAGSGGDMFPWLFRHAKLGKLIGTRTWGGLVGISGNPRLIDGGRVTVPTFGFFETDGTWGVEGHGVDPDIEVIDDPALMVDNGDPQLDAAIQHMLEEIERNPYIPPKRPADPDRSGMGITDEDK